MAYQSIQRGWNSVEHTAILQNSLAVDVSGSSCIRRNLNKSDSGKTVIYRQLIYALFEGDKTVENGLKHTFDRAISSAVVCRVRYSCLSILLQRDPSSRISARAMLVEKSRVASIYSPMEAFVFVGEAGVSSNDSALVPEGVLAVCCAFRPMLVPR